MDVGISMQKGKQTKIQLAPVLNAHLTLLDL